MWECACTVRVWSFHHLYPPSPILTHSHSLSPLFFLSLPFPSIHRGLKIILSSLPPLPPPRSPIPFVPSVPEPLALFPSSLIFCKLASYPRPRPRPRPRLARVKLSVEGKGRFLDRREDKPYKPNPRSELDCRGGPVSSLSFLSIARTVLPSTATQTLCWLTQARLTSHITPAGTCVRVCAGRCIRRSFCLPIWVVILSLCLVLDFYLSCSCLWVCLESPSPCSVLPCPGPSFSGLLFCCQLHLLGLVGASSQSVS